MKNLRDVKIFDLKGETVGWDAFAMKNNNWVASHDSVSNCLIIWDRELSIAFADADKIVKDCCSFSDSLLKFGGLDVEICGEIINLATGINHYVSLLSIQGVKYGFASWKMIIPDDFKRYPPWARMSAYLFLKTCVENDLEIRFSF